MAKHFKNTIAWLKKADMLAIQPNGNHVDMTDGRMVARVPSYYYETEFMPSSPRFRAVEDGHYYKANDRKAIPEEIPSGYNIDKFLAVGDRADYARDTGMIFVQSESEKLYQHLYIRYDGTSYAIVREEFHKILDEFKSDKANDMYMVNRVSPICVHPMNGDEVGWGCCVLPISSDLKEKIPIEVMQMASEVSVDIK